ncbi:MAG: DUF3127 domain-containing protein [Chlorobiales bacterium]|nr:DUF3127 domain-containing protein [Chlorobiales bacterium]
MQLTAKLTAILPEQTGAGKNGPWKKQDIIVETDGQYPKKVCISLWGEKFDRNLLRVGNRLTISFDIESREFNGKWYTDVKAWKIESVNDAASSQSQQAGSYRAPIFEHEGGRVIADDDCPF